MAAKRPVRLFLDWDGTTVISDTLSLIAAIGYTKNAHRKLPPWSYFTYSYMSDYSANAASYKPQKANRKSVAQELAWLGSLVDVERASIERVEAAGIFADVSALDVRTAAVQAAKKEQVRLRPGLKELLEAVAGSRGSAYIISVNWSGAFITEFFKSASAVTRSFEEVYANELSFGGNGQLNRVFGKENRGIWTAEDKSRILKQVTSMHDRGETTVYIGDSLTDLGCLLSVDVGICVRDESMGSEQRSLAEALERLRISTRWIGEYGLPIERQNGSAATLGKTLWWARDFKEVADSPVFAS